jgi:hypothetical protein
MKGRAMKFEEVIQLQALKLKAMNSYGSVPSSVVDDMAEASPQLRQMCAKVSPHLYDELENVCNLLDMSKRQFIEGAVADALARAKETIEKVGALDQGTL